MENSKSGLMTMVVALGLISLVAAFSLGFVYDFTKAPIAQAKLDKQKRAIGIVAPSFTNNPIEEQIFVAFNQNAYRRISDTDGVEEYFTAYPIKDENTHAGYAIISNSKNGYSGLIELMVGVDPTGKVMGTTILAHKETPGLGSKIESPDFLRQYIDQGLDTYSFTVKKDGGEVDAISGATISTRAVNEAIKKALEIHNFLSDEERT